MREQPLNGGSLYETPALDEDESTKELVRELLAETKRFAAAEMRLAKVEMESLTNEARARLQYDVRLAQHEIKEGAKQAGRAGAMTGSGALLLQATVYFLLLALLFGLSRVMPAWGAALIVAAIAGIAGAALAFGGVKLFKRVRLSPRRTMENVKGDTQWMNQRMRGLRSRILASE
jgi:hypothetical protein